MTMSPRPRILYLYDPDYGNLKFPYVFACLPQTLKAMEIDVEFLNIAAATFEDYKTKLTEFEPELLLGFVQSIDQVFKYADFLNEYHPVPAVNWFHEEPNGLCVLDSERLINASAAFDCWFGIDRNMVPIWKTKAFFLPPGYDAAVFQNTGAARIYDISYIGQLGPAIATEMYWPYMKELARYRKKTMLCIERPMGIPRLPRKMERFMRSPGNRRFLQKLPFWKCRWTNPKNEPEKAAIINQSNIHFGMNRVRGPWEEDVKKNIPDYPLDSTGLFYQLKSRPFQATGAGAMSLNEYCPELEELFEIGKEIVTFEYGNFEEVRDKLKWYTTHDRERQAIAAAGHKRALNSHTLTHRIEEIIATVKDV